ncbi:MAG: hypothetical protein ABIS03_12305 [Gemmatimonadaceae bacterium]
MSRKFVSILPFLGAIALFACNSTAVPGDGDPPRGSIGSIAQQSEWAAIEQLEAQARAIAKVEGCAASSDCRAAPVGNRACGGPRYYLPYCGKTTDSAALYKKLDEVKSAEDAYNRKYQISSTCEFRMPPTVVATGGSCSAQ